MGDPITRKEKQRRVAEAMNLQQEISLEKNLALVGQSMKVLIDRIDDGVAYGRTEFDTPEVDNEVIIQTAQHGFDVSTLSIGSFYNVEVVDAEAFDLFGSIVGRA